MKWENIKSLLRLAVINDRLTEQQSEFLEKEFWIVNATDHILRIRGLDGTIFVKLEYFTSDVLYDKLMEVLS